MGSDRAFMAFPRGTASLFDAQLDTSAAKSRGPPEREAFAHARSCARRPTPPAGDRGHRGRARRGGLSSRATGPLTFVHTDDLAEHLVAATNPAIPNGSRIDIGCDRAVSINELAEIMTHDD